MNQDILDKIDRVNNKPLLELLEGLWAVKAILICHDLKLFSMLENTSCTISELCEKLNLATRSAQAITSVCLSCDLLQIKEGRYSLTELAEIYFLESSPAYFGEYLDLIIVSDEMSSFQTVKKAVLENKSQVYAGEDMYNCHKEQQAQARAFTRAMHGVSISPALVWPKHVDLSEQKLMLDIGGGSGAHCIGATQHWPNLQAIVFDLPSVCEAAKEVIAEYNMQERIKTHAADIWDDPFPLADIHFFSIIYHNWSSEKCRSLTQKSFDSLESGGRIIIHEVLYNDDKTGPVSAAIDSIITLVCSNGQAYSGQELSSMLMETGFTDIEVKPTFSYWSIVTAIKP